jgi:hypothetical protein
MALLLELLTGDTHEGNNNRQHNGSTTLQWCSRQWAWKLYHHLEMVHTFAGFMARFTICSHCHIHTRQIS